MEATKRVSKFDGAENRSLDSVESRQVESRNLDVHGLGCDEAGEEVWCGSELDASKQVFDFVMISLLNFFIRC